jgi:DNA-binding LytR/AlgR family response regulator
MPIDCVVIEDEPLALERTCGFVQRVPELRLLARFSLAADAIRYLEHTKPQLLLLDIHLGSVSGIRLLETIQTDAAVIFTTAYPDYALKGYDLQITDYLLKPFTFERFVQAIDKVKALIHLQARAADRPFFFVRSANAEEKIYFDELFFIEGMRDYRRIHTLHKKVMTLQTFTKFEQELPAELVCRVHKSFMVALDKITVVRADSIEVRGITIPVSATYREQLLQQLKG